MGLRNTVEFPHMTLFLGPKILGSFDIIFFGQQKVRCDEGGHV